MNGDTLGTLAIALACVLALSVTGSAIQSTVSPAPAEAIDVDPASLPLSQADAKDLKQRVQQPPDDPPEGVEGETDVEDVETEDLPESVDERSVEGVSDEEAAALAAAERPAARRTVVRRGRADEGGLAAARGFGADAGGGDASSGDGAQSGPNDGELRDRTPLDRLVSLTGGLLDGLLSVLPTVALLIAVTLGVRFRERIGERLREFLGRLRGSGDPAQGADGEPEESGADPVPRNGVDEAWAELLDGIDRSRDPTVSPADCARAAVEAGFDPDGVRTLRAVYEEVRYGDEPVTRRRERAAWEGLERSRNGRST